MKKLFLTLTAILGILAAQAQCLPQFTWANSPSGNSLLNVSFTNTTSTASNYVSYTIHFGDNTSQSGFTGTVHHNYAAPGTYNVMLHMVSYDSLNPQNSCNDSILQQITVNYPACGVTFTKQNQGNGTYTFTADNPANTPGLTYSWNFGDGSTATGNPVTHTYATSTVYNVTLTATGANCSYTNTDSLAVYLFPLLNCDSIYVGFTSSNSSIQTISFLNTSTDNSIVNTTSTATWYFGDGSSSTIYSPTHTYPAPGTYNVLLVNSFLDNVTQQVLCSDSATQQVTVNPVTGPINCDSIYVGFTVSSINNLTAVFNNTSTDNSIVTTSGTATWYFGDGTTSTNYSPTHTYAASGTYTVKLVHTFRDSITQQVLCSDSATQQVVINPVNAIRGNIYRDSLSAVSYDSFKVWLIVHDSVANTLTAVDSLLATGYISASYTFPNKPAGAYLVKAAILNLNPGSLGPVPTYHYSSLYWNTATVIYHNGGNTIGKHVNMQQGIVPSGPGFIGGNISMGAGKGTGTGVAGLLVFARDNNDQLVSAVYTDANGDFSFEHLPLGSYTIYPEEMNYSTTPSAQITIASGNLTETEINFEQTDSEIKPTAGTTGIAASIREDLLKVYPNPITDALFIDNKSGEYNEVSIVNTVGQTVHHTAIRKGINRITASGLAQGIYFLIITGKDHKDWIKITKQ
jgi:PKD repeat protein